MLSANVTLTDLVADERLSNPKRFLRKALANMLFAENLEGVSLRLGRSGKGTWPHYVLEKVPSGSMIGRYDGQTHQAWNGGEEHHEENWSGDKMSGDAIYQLWRQVTFDDRTPATGEAPPHG